MVSGVIGYRSGSFPRQSIFRVGSVPRDCLALPSRAGQRGQSLAGHSLTSRA